MKNDYEILEEMLGVKTVDCTPKNLTMKHKFTIEYDDKKLVIESAVEDLTDFHYDVLYPSLIFMGFQGETIKNYYDNAGDEKE